MSEYGVEYIEEIGSVLIRKRLNIEEKRLEGMKGCCTGLV